MPCDPRTHPFSCTPADPPPYNLTDDRTSLPEGPEPVTILLLVPLPTNRAALAVGQLCHGVSGAAVLTASPCDQAPGAAHSTVRDPQFLPLLADTGLLGRSGSGRQAIVHCTFSQDSDVKLLSIFLRKDDWSASPLVHCGQSPSMPSPCPQPRAVRPFVYATFISVSKAL